jgi:hypothetical protein
MVGTAHESALEIEALGESRGHCDCCGTDSRSVWGLVHQQDGPTVAAYWMHWTVAHLQSKGANLDLVLGRWGEGTEVTDRFGVALIHREQEDGTPSLMVVDAADRFESATLASTAMARSDVIGTPLSEQVFSIVDAIYTQDGRFF